MCRVVKLIDSYNKTSVASIRSWNKSQHFYKYETYLLCIKTVRLQNMILPSLHLQVVISRIQPKEMYTCAIIKLLCYIITFFHVIFWKYLCVHLHKKTVWRIDDLTISFSIAYFWILQSLQFFCDTLMQCWRNRNKPNKTNLTVNKTASGYS